jgi:hypothetical protein
VLNVVEYINPIPEEYKQDSVYYGENEVKE